MEVANTQGGVLIAGSGGLIGSYLARAFGERACLPTRAELDLFDEGAVEAYLRSQAIGAVLNATGAAGKPVEDMVRVHGFLTRSLARAAGRAGVAAIHLSSSRVFSGLEAEPYRESDRPDPMDDYGLSKFLGERFATLAGSRAYVVRLPMVLGLRPDGGPGRQLANRLLERAAAGRPVQVAEDVTTQAVHAEAIAPFLARILAEGTPPGIYHLSGPAPASLHALFLRLFAACGLEPPVPVPARTLQPTGHLARNLALAAGRLGPVSTWQDAVDRFAAEVLASPLLKDVPHGL